METVSCAQDELLDGKFNRLIYSFASKLRRSLPSWDGRSTDQLFRDLFSYAFVVSCSFDKERGVKFVTFLTVCLRNELKTELRRSYRCPIPVDAQESVHTCFRSKHFLPPYRSSSILDLIAWEEIVENLSMSSEKVLFGILESKELQDIVYRHKKFFPIAKVSNFLGYPRSWVIRFVVEFKFLASKYLSDEITCEETEDVETVNIGS